jgi:hypothetical protein
MNAKEKSQVYDWERYGKIRKDRILIIDFIIKLTKEWIHCDTVFWQHFG